MKILLADKLAPFVASKLEDAGFSIYDDPSLKDDSLLAVMEEFKPEILVVRSTKVLDSHIEKTPSLSLIIRAGAGVNTIAIDTASKKGIFVANCPGKNAIAVAELVMGHIINLDRKICDNHIDFKAGNWNKKKYSKAEGLFGKKMAVLGMGAIGLEVTKRAKAFGLEVQAWSRSLTPTQAKTLGITFCATKEDAVAGADVLSVHLPATENTKRLLNRELFSLLNDNAFVINTSRGSLLDEKDLLEMIEKKNLSAGLDVFDNEPSSNDSKHNSDLKNNPNIYVTHHIGASTNQATESVGQAVLDIILHWKEKGLVLNCVNIAKQSSASHCLSVRHADKVGVLASILEHVKGAGLNIQEMDNIIFQGGKAACARIFLVGTPNEALLYSLQNSPDIFSCSISSL